MQKGHPEGRPLVVISLSKLLYDFRNNTGTNCTATFADREAEAF
ncbi:MAG: hypothetical protein ACJAX9_002731, partial [Celeribacter sp.]